MDINRFESLGDNCEFGFIMRENRVRSSSLLRWAIANPVPLRKALRNRFAKLYEFENLEPANVDMVVDHGTNLRFHSEMVKDRVLVENPRAVYDEEIGKIRMLRKRLLNQLADPNMIFVYKTREPLPPAFAQEMADLIAGYGEGANLLYVTAEGRVPPGEVKKMGDHLYYAGIDRFADYRTARDSSREMWQKIMETADAMIPGAA